MDTLSTARPDRTTETTAVALARAVASGEVAAVDVAREHLDRIDRLNGPLRAVVTVDRDAVIRRATEADEALARGESWGPLHGVPVTIKDSFETAGLRTTSSHPAMAAHLPDRDATAVARLTGAGAIVLGKTNLPELERDVQSWSPLFGRAANPWDLTRTPGGSTGGGAAAVAAGLSPLELGSDTAGSIRIPAHFTGTVALKPTLHRVSLAGKVPPRLDRPRGMRHLSVPGAIARSVADLALWLSVVEGADARDPDAAAAPGTDTGELPDRPLRVAFTASVPGVPVAGATVEALRAVAASARRTGTVVDEVDAPLDWTAALTTYGEVWGAECGLGLPRHVRLLAPLAGRVAPRTEVVARGIARGMSFDMAGYAAALTRRDTLIGDLEAFLARYDAWLLPVTSGPAFTHRRPGLLRTPDPVDVDGRPVSYDLATLGHTAPFSATGHPVVTLPLRRPVGELPIGVQVVGRLWHDRRLLAVAAELARVTGPFTPPPGY